MLGFLVSCGARILRGIVGEVSGARQRLQQLFQESSRRFLLPKWVLSVIRIVGQAQILSEFIEAERVFWLVWILQRRILKLSLLPWKKKWKRNIVSQCLPIGNKILFFFFFLFGAFPMPGQYYTHQQQFLLRLFTIIVTDIKPALASYSVPL